MGPWEVFAQPCGATTFKAVLLTFGIYGGNYVMITRLPAYLKIVLNLSIVSAAGYLATLLLGFVPGTLQSGTAAGTGVFSPNFFRRTSAAPHGDLPAMPGVPQEPKCQPWWVF